MLGLDFLFSSVATYTYKINVVIDGAYTPAVSAYNLSVLGLPTRGSKY